MDEQQREGRLEPGPADRLRRARALDLERSEVAESHPRHGGEDLTGNGKRHNRDVPEEVVPRAVVLVEGVSDRAALVELARRRGDDLAADGVAVVAMGGATNVGHHVRRWAGRGVRLGGLCDLGEAAWFARAWASPDARCRARRRGVRRRPRGRADPGARRGGRRRGDPREGELASLQTLRRQPAQRTRLPQEHLHRFLGARSGNKERFARLLVGAVDLDRVPPVLHAVLDHALR